MNIPGYDAWRLRGPSEERGQILEACEECKGIGKTLDEAGEPQPCEECDGTGDVLATLDEPDGDYEYERKRDAQWEDGK